MNTVCLPPVAPVLIEATRAIGYSLETAIADIVDNSIVAGAGVIDMYFFPIDDPYVAILDNGVGMDAEELLVAMRYGSRDPLESRSELDLGRFGLGLKTASMSQCRKLTVISKKDGSYCGAQWDLDFIDITRDWSLKLLDNTDMELFPHFTDLINNADSGSLIIWQELDRMKLGESNFEDSFGRKMDNVREHLSLVFHRYIMGETGLKKVSISINKLPLEAIDPFLAGKSTQVMDDELILINGERVVVRPYILPHSAQLTDKELSILGGKEGLRRQQGFYVYRNKRLIVWGSWFRMMRQGELSKLARVRVDIPNSLDSLWELDIKKSTAYPPEVVRKNLANIIEKITQSSKRTWVFRGKKEMDDSRIHMWARIRTRNGGIIYELNRDHPLVEKIRDLLDDDNKNFVEELLIHVGNTLPLNQLYVDLTSDERIENDSEMNKEALLSTFKQLVSHCRDSKVRLALVERLLVTEPFYQHRDWITASMEEVNSNA